MFRQTNIFKKWGLLRKDTEYILHKCIILNACWILKRVTLIKEDHVKTEKKGFEIKWKFNSRV